MLIRKNQANLTEDEWNKFIPAVKAIKTVGAASLTYRELARIHTPEFHEHTAHSFPEFLPWHREYLWIFERRINEVDSDVTLPYWNWLEDRKIPKKLSKASNWGVSRDMDANDLVDDYTFGVNRAMSETDFEGFDALLMGPHNGIHRNVGGQMGDMIRSPEDILFWLHHCFLDKLWAEWQNSNPGAERNMPPELLVKLQTKLLPSDIFTRTGIGTLSISNMEYKYE